MGARCDVMKAIVQERFGSPDVLRLVEIERPDIGPGEVLVRVRAAALNPYDWHMLRGDPMIARLIPKAVGVTRPRNPVAGLDAAGVVDRVGAGVSGLQQGDEVLGFCPGALAEYAKCGADNLVRKPASLTFEQAATLPIAATTALRGVSGVGQVRDGDRVLIIGAAGGVGHFAVQLAANLGAEVTGVCGPGGTDLVRSLGAARVIDYTSADFTSERARYDVIFDNVGNRPLRLVRRALTPAGTLVLNGGGPPGKVIGAIAPMLGAAAVNGLVRQHLRFLPSRQDKEELSTLVALVDDGKLTAVIDRAYPLADTADGLRYVEAGHVHGKVVVTVA
jgi:NADPH:quinone reductase-like Zn-dependent oxidoreductase